MTAGYLPAWAEDDPTEVGVPPEELPQRLAFVNHRVGRDPQGLADIAASLREHAEMLDRRVRPALVAARDDWAARGPR